MKIKIAFFLLSIAAANLSLATQDLVDELVKNAITDFGLSIECKKLAEQKINSSIELMSPPMYQPYQTVTVKGGETPSSIDYRVEYIKGGYVKKSMIRCYIDSSKPTPKARNVGVLRDG